MRHMQTFSEESLRSLGEKHYSLLHILKVFHVTPHPIKTFHCHFKLPSPRPPAPDRQWHSFSSTHSPCGREAQQSVPVGSLLASQYLFLLTHETDHWKSRKPLRCICRHRQHPVFLFVASGSLTQHIR